MKSNKQRRTEIKAKRRALAKLIANVTKISLLKTSSFETAVADHSQLAHCLGFLPDMYVDKPFLCRDCNSEEVWTAKQQKWWYEVMKADLNSMAVRCRPCRLAERARVDEARRISMAGMARKQAEKELRTP